MYEIFLVSVKCKGVVWYKWKDNIKMEEKWNWAGGGGSVNVFGSG
jgi:hypothetical protein